MSGNDPDYYFEHCLCSNGGTTLDAFAPEMLAEYRRCWRDPAMITACCSDYRAGSTIDLEHDASENPTKVTCPLMAQWAEHGITTTLLDIPGEWAQRCTRVTPAPVPGGPFFPHTPD